MSEEELQPSKKESKPFEKLLNLTPSIFGLLIVSILGFDAFGTNNSILEQLANPEYARGLITLLFSIATIWVAIILAVGAFRTTDEKKFNRAKDVLIVLVGIFGTIIGYYFGSTENNGVDSQETPSVEITSQEDEPLSKTDSLHLNK